MGNVNPTLRNRVRYTLKNKNFKPLEITEPIGWKDDDKEFAKIKGYDGIFTNFSNSLKFIGEGKDYILLVDALEDINGDIRLTKDVRHPKTDKWERSYDGFLDLTTLEEDNGYASVKFNASGLEKLIKSRESEQLELERTDTLDGVEIGPLLPKKVALNGRKIFLKSLLEVKETSKNITGFRMEFRGGWRWQILPVPLDISYRSDENIHRVVSTEPTGETTPDIGGMFYFNSGNNDRILNLDLALKSKIKMIRLAGVDDVAIKVILYKYLKNVDTYSITESIVLYTMPNPYSSANYQINTALKTKITVKPNEGLMLNWLAGGEFKVPLYDLGNDHLKFDIENIESSINIEEDSFYEKSQANVLLPYEVCNRLLQIITGRTDALYSEALGRTDLGYAEDGVASLIGMTHGHWIRDFQQGDELYKKFTTSLKDFFTSFLATNNLTVGIEKIGFKERIRIEEKKFFYNRNVTIKLGKVINGKFEYIQVSNVKRSKVIEHYHSSLEVGYEKGGEYEEINGLWEYNAKSTFTTPINRLKGTLQIVSKYRADLIGQEIARRKPKKDFPTEDTNYDKDIFLNDLKRGITDVFEQRVWTDDFDQQPTGTYDPESATNLRLSPFNMLLRHGSTITSGLTKNLSEFIRYGSTTGNSNLKTKLIGKPEYAENGNIEISKLEKARFVPTLIKFEYPVDFEMTQILAGSSVILGKTIPNVYGLVAFKNEKGEIEKGYLDNLKPNNKGNWEILKFNK